MGEPHRHDGDDRRPGSERPQAQAYEDAWYRALKAKSEQRAAAEAAAKEREDGRPE